ncbi:hypothetical protein INR49_007902 [Caranx melampygus]|nr:hypothetical protein INR49_007902 [Caranx melampygus]
MKLRVRINRQTCRVELPGAEPSLRELMDHIQETVLSSHGLSADTEFTLSLNGSDRLSDSGQTLSSLGIVSGDLICVILPESAAAAPAPAPAPGPTSSSGSSSSDRPSSSSGSQGQRRQQMAAVSSDQASSSRHPAAFTQSDPTETLDPDPDLVPVPIPSWEPMLCSEAGEGQAPLSLELLYHTAQTSSPSDAIMVAGNLLMLETGFIPQGADLKSTQMPDGWRSGGGVYKMQYTHPLCENSVAMVVGVCMGPVLVINATLKVNQIVDTVRKLCLNPSSYITDEWPGESAAAAFKDLTKLSRVFKDQLAYPLIAAAREVKVLETSRYNVQQPPKNMT